MKKSSDAAKGKRYTDQEKSKILAYVDSVNAKQKRGGQSAAAKKFGLSQLTLSKWLFARQGAGAKKPGAISGQSAKLAKLSALAKTIEAREAEINSLKTQFRNMIETW